MTVKKIAPARQQAYENRLINVMMTIAEYGPLTLNELTVRTGISRSAVHRAAVTLERNGVVRARAADHAYEIMSPVADKMASANAAPAIVKTISPLMKDLLRRKRVHCDLAAKIGDGPFCVIESTRSRDIYQLDLSDGDNSLLRAVRAGIRSEQIIWDEQHGSAAFAIPSDEGVAALQLWQSARPISDRGFEALVRETRRKILAMSLV